MIVYTDNKEKKVDTPVGHIDIVPTILSLLDTEIPEKYTSEDLLSIPEREGMCTESKSGDCWQTSYMENKQNAPGFLRKRGFLVMRGFFNTS